MKTLILNLLTENGIVDVIGGNFTYPLSMHNSLSILKLLQNSACCWWGRRNFL